MARNAFNLIVSGIAAVATFAFTGNFALSAAVFSLGNVALSLINPSTPSAELDDLRANKSSYGEFIHIPYNDVRLGAHLVWASIVRAKKRGHGGYEYGQDLRFLVCEVPRIEAVDAFVTVKRIWLNKQLVYTIDENDELSNIIDLITTRVAIPVAGTGAWLSKLLPVSQDGTNGIQVITIFHGEPTQQPWDVQAAALGPDNTPAYRGVLSIGIANCPLHLYGNAIPQVEVEVDTRTIGVNPDFVVYDPAWEAGHPIVAHTEWTGYRAVTQILANPVYHPDTMFLLMADNEDEAGSPAAIGRRDALTGEWERSEDGSEKVAILDYDGTGDGFVWLDYMSPIYHPPNSDKLYTYRFLDESGSGGTTATSWWVEIDDDYPFAFSKMSATPAAMGETTVFDGCFQITSNADGSMLAALHSGSAISGDRHVAWSMWAPGSNSVAYFRSDDAAFAGLWTTGSGTPVSHMPQGVVIDKHDHLWIFTGSIVDNAQPLHLDEFSWSVGGGTITLTHLNRYTLNNQDGGLNSWTYSIYGLTYNEVLDEFVIHWSCSNPSWTHFGHDPLPDFTPYSALESSNVPTQFRITHWDLTGRAKKLSEADSVRLNDGYGSYLDNFGGNGPFDAGGAHSGIAGFLGTDANYHGDRIIGGWTTQEWTVYAHVNPGSPSDAHTGFWLVDTDTGIGELYGPRLWDDFIDPDYPEDNPPGNAGVYWFGGAIFEPATDCFWAARRGDLSEGDFTDISETVFLGATQGFGRYFLEPGSAPQPFTLQQINEDLAERTYALTAGDDTDFAELADIVPGGYDVDQRRSAAASIDQLRVAYLYDIIEEDHLLVARLRESNTSLATIDESEVLAVDGQRHIKFTDGNEQELPRWLDLTYYDLTREGQTGIEPAYMAGGSPNDRNALKLAVAVYETPDWAATQAQRILRSGWIEKERTAWGFPQRYLKYGPADVITLTRGTLSFEVKIGDNAIGASWGLAYEAVSHDSGTYSITARGKVNDPAFVPSVFGGSSGTPPAISIVPEPRLVVIDTALVDESDDTPGYFVTAFPLLAANQGGVWNGADGEQSTASDGAYSLKGRVEDPPIAGECVNTLPDAESWASWDRETILKVTITSGAKPKSVDETRLWMEQDLNLTLVGDELIQWATVVEKANNEFWFTDLLRGRLGTEWAIPNHAADEAFVVYDKTKFISFTHNASLIGITRYWRAKNDWAGQFSEVVSTDQESRRLIPLAPYFIQGHYDSGNNLTGTFIPRHRGRGAALQEPTEMEATDDYEVDIVTASGGVVRTISSTASAGGSVVTPSARTFYYSAADQLSDWGSLQPNYDVEIFKMSAVVGRGYPGRATV